ncbi:PTPLA-domain-containing protein [Sphaerulina musiva SO2202]|uniref:Very-long-chain (3R)-3-hydroxyacyl-CoA dehydratase n=1 Tax=Sphaerulina musiva (strain SO2202) TaxID=692275 RepID=N1QE20_SPHMS|nr:PTPLA-domain-containing protein [Sphaerulina musiva SO2202]EMF10515.1 PTPLA-domain-containing protein [Sphaerulina musiva SO2202]
MASSINPRKTYLTIYNLTFASLWTWIFLSTLSSTILSTSSSSSSSPTIFQTLSPRTRWIQTLSLLDILHSLTRLIPAPLFSTFTQIATRVIQVWLIWYTYPETTSEASFAFPALLLAWSAADAIRYVFLTLHLWGRAPRGLVWVRYSMFYVLYPVGIGAEWWLMFRAVRPAGEVSWVLGWVFWFLLGLYGPVGAYMMFTYMVKQRKKTLSKLEQK